LPARTLWERALFLIVADEPYMAEAIRGCYRHGKAIEVTSQPMATTALGLLGASNAYEHSPSSMTGRPGAVRPERGIARGTAIVASGSALPIIMLTLGRRLTTKGQPVRARADYSCWPKHIRAAFIARLR